MGPYGNLITNCNLTAAKSNTILYFFWTTKVFPKFPVPFESQARFQSEEFGSYDNAPLSLSLVTCSLSSLSVHPHAKKTAVDCL